MDCMMLNQIASPTETHYLCGSAQPAQPAVNIPSTAPQEFDLLAVERELMAAAGCPAELLPTLPAFTPEEGHRFSGGFGV